MTRAVAGPLAILLALPLAGCLRTSEVQLSVFVRQATLEGVTQFPVRLLIDMGTSQNQELHICEWEGGFLETDISVNTYDKCPEPLTIEGVVVPLTEACDDGAFRFTLDWPEDGTVVYGRGSVDVFQDGFCNSVEDRQLALDPVEPE